MNRLYYIFSGRFPSEKAHALYVTKCCESFAHTGVKTTVIVPRRLGRAKEEYTAFFSVEKSFDVVYLPTIDLYKLPIPLVIAFFAHYITFSFFVVLYALFKISKQACIISNEYLSLYLLSFFRKNLVFEMHDYISKKNKVAIWLLPKLRFVVTQNSWKKKKLADDYGVDTEKIIVEPNGVDIEKFDILLTREEAREKLGLPQDKHIIVYTGHLFGWKGTHTLAEAGRLIADSNVEIYFIGGSKHDVERFKREYGECSSIHVVGYRPHEEIPLWQKSANVLVLPNTAKEDISKYYTSPMKLFEYMASRTPIIASDLPSIREVVSENEVYFVAPDNPEALAEAIRTSKSYDASWVKLATEARSKIEEYTWDKRAKRILAIIQA